MIVAKCEVEREEKLSGLMGNRGLEMRYYRITHAIRKEK